MMSFRREIWCWVKQRIWWPWEDRMMVDQLRFDLRFPNEATAAGFCVKI